MCICNHIPYGRSSMAKMEKKGIQMITSDQMQCQRSKVSHIDKWCCPKEAEAAAYYSVLEGPVYAAAKSRPWNWNIHEGESFAIFPKISPHETVFTVTFWVKPISPEEYFSNRLLISSQEVMNFTEGFLCRNKNKAIVTMNITEENCIGKCKSSVPELCDNGFYSRRDNICYLYMYDSSTGIGNQCEKQGCYEVEPWFECLSAFLYFEPMTGNKAVTIALHTMSSGDAAVDAMIYQNTYFMQASRVGQSFVSKFPASGPLDESTYMTAFNNDPFPTTWRCVCVCVRMSVFVCVVFIIALLLPR